MDLKLKSIIFIFIFFGLSNLGWSVIPIKVVSRHVWVATIGGKVVDRESTESFSYLFVSSSGEKVGDQWFEPDKCSHFLESEVVQVCLYPLPRWKNREKYTYFPVHQDIQRVLRAKRDARGQKRIIITTQVLSSDLTGDRFLWDTYPLGLVDRAASPLELARDAGVKISCPEEIAKVPVYQVAEAAFDGLICPEFRTEPWLAGYRSGDLSELFAFAKRTDLRNVRILAPALGFSDGDKIMVPVLEIDERGQKTISCTNDYFGSVLFVRRSDAE